MIYLTAYLFVGFCIYGYALRTQTDWLVLVCAIFVGPIDIFLNYTWYALFTWDYPRKGEYTFSMRLERLVLNTDWRGKVARPIAWVLNKIIPGHISTYK